MLRMLQAQQDRLVPPAANAQPALPTATHSTRRFCAASRSARSLRSRSGRRLALGLCGGLALLPARLALCLLGGLRLALLRAPFLTLRRQLLLLCAAWQLGKGQA